MLQQLLATHCGRLCLQLRWQQKIELKLYQIRLSKAFVTLHALMKSDDLRNVDPLTLLFFGSVLNACFNTTYEANTSVALNSLKGVDISI